MATPNGTQFQVATDSGFATKQVDYNGVYKTSHLISTGVMTRGVLLYARVRHSSTESGFSAWSPTRQFSVSLYLRMVAELGYVGYTTSPCDITTDTSGKIYVLAWATYQLRLSIYTAEGVLINILIISSPYGFCPRTAYPNPVARILILSTGVICIGATDYTDVTRTKTKGTVFTMSSSGTIGWHVNYAYPNVAGSMWFNGMSIDSSNNIYVAGTSDGQVLGDARYGLLVKITATGTTLWNKLLRNAAGGWGIMFKDVTIAPNGNICVCGVHQFANTGYGFYSGIVVSVSPAGELLNKISATMDFLYANTFFMFENIVTDSSSNIYLSGKWLSNNTSVDPLTQLRGAIFKLSSALTSPVMYLTPLGFDMDGVELKSDTELWWYGSLYMTTTTRKQFFTKINPTNAGIYLCLALAENGNNGHVFESVKLNMGGVGFLSSITRGDPKALFVGIGNSAEGALGVIPNLTTYSWENPTTFTLSNLGSATFSTTAVWLVGNTTITNGIGLTATAGSITETKSYY